MSGANGLGTGAKQNVAPVLASESSSSLRENCAPKSCCLIVVAQSPLLFRVVDRYGEKTFPSGPTNRSLPNRLVLLFVAS